MTRMLALTSTNLSLRYVHAPIIEKMTTKIHPNLMVEQTTSTSPKILTPNTLMTTMTTQKMLIQAAIGTLSVQKPNTVHTAWSSLEIVMT